jgi:putative ABC transport system substrate-binding protein
MRMRRRHFIASLGAAAAWPLATSAQQPERMRRIGIIWNVAADDPKAQARLTAFEQALRQRSWTDGRNVRMDMRWNSINIERARRYAAELLALSPDIILVATLRSLQALLEATRTLPIVFVNVIEPVGTGFVASLKEPGGNATGFTLFEYGMSAKWLQLLKEVAPRVTRVAVLGDPTQPGAAGQLSTIQAVAPSFRVEVFPIDIRDASEIESAIAAFAREPMGGLIVLASPVAVSRRELIITLAARHQLPAVYPYRYNVAGGGLISYRPDLVDEYRRAADYVDRILRGAKAGDLPVQAPVKYELAISLKTAKALGLEIPPTLLARADGVIE